jgi:type IV secretion system protein VirB5
MLVALTGVGGMIHIGQLSKFVPYVIQVDKLGQTAAIARADRASPVDGRVVASVVSAFISNSRIVTIDIALQRKAVMDVYAMLAPGDPSLQKMTEWLNGTEESSPFKRAIKEMVSVEVVNVLAQTPDTWEVDWIETTRDRQGVVTGKPSYMRALVNIKVVEPTPATSEEQIRKNPMGIYVKDFSWSRQQQF